MTMQEKNRKSWWRNRRKLAIVGAIVFAFPFVAVFCDNAFNRRPPDGFSLPAGCKVQVSRSLGPALKGGIYEGDIRFVRATSVEPPKVLVTLLARQLEASVHGCTSVEISRRDRVIKELTWPRVSAGPSGSGWTIEDRGGHHCTDIYIWPDGNGSIIEAIEGTALN